MPDEGQNNGKPSEENQGSGESPEENQGAGETSDEEQAGEETPEAEQRTEVDEWNFEEDEATPETADSASGRSAEDKQGAEDEQGAEGDEVVRATTATNAADDTTTESGTASTSGSAKRADEVFCESCGEAIKREAEICPHCGVSQKGSQSTGDVEKNPGLAALASLILPGAGEVYNGEFVLGGVVFLVYVVLWSVWSGLLLLITVVTFGIGAILWVFWPLGLLMNPISAYISYTRAERINAGEIQV